MTSIITITYNAEQWLERTMQSVLAQNCTDYEYIIVDGASKDGTVDIIKRLEPVSNVWNRRSRDVCRGSPSRTKDSMTQ